MALSQGALCVLLADRMKDERLVVMEICSRDAHGASEAMSHKSTYALHLPRRHESFPEIFQHVISSSIYFL